MVNCKKLMPWQKSQGGVNAPSDPVAPEEELSLECLFQQLHSRKSEFPESVVQPPLHSIHVLLQWKNTGHPTPHKERSWSTISVHSLSSKTRFVRSTEPASQPASPPDFLPASCLPSLLPAVN